MMIKKSTAAALAAALAAAAVAASAAPALAASAPSAPTRVSVKCSYTAAEVRWVAPDNASDDVKASWKLPAGSDTYQVRYATDRSMGGAVSIKAVSGGSTTVEGLAAGTDYYFQARAGKTYKAKSKVSKSTYDKVRAAGGEVAKSSKRQYKKKAASGKWSSWKSSKPSGYKRSSKRFRARTVTTYYKVASKVAWSAWTSNPAYGATSELPAANLTEKGRAVFELVVPAGSVAVSYCGLSVPWGGSESTVTKLRLDRGGSLWQPADEKRASGTYEGDYDTGDKCFGGWYLDKALTEPCTTASTALAAAQDGSVTLYAKWTDHSYKTRRIYRNVTFDCGFLKGLLPIDNVSTGHYFVDGYYADSETLAKSTSRSANTSKPAKTCELVWSGAWLNVQGMPTDLNSYHADGSNGFEVGVRYDPDTCTWTKVGIGDGTYYHDYIWRTNNFNAMLPMEYEVCTECNHVGKRITDLPYGTVVGALKCTDESKQRLKGNVAGCITEETVTTPYGNPYTVDGNPYTGSTPLSE